jgi:hypothetical protein
MSQIWLSRAAAGSVIILLNCMSCFLLLVVRRAKTVAPLFARAGGRTSVLSPLTRPQPVKAFVKKPFENRLHDRSPQM